MGQQKKILMGFICDGHAGGIDKYMLDTYNAADKGRFHIDFLTNIKAPELECSLAQNNSKLFKVATLKHPIAQYREIKSIIKTEGYDTVYLNISTALSIVAIIAAKRAGVKNRWVHSHSSGIDEWGSGKRWLYYLLHKLFRLFLHSYATSYFACSTNAGIWMFPKKKVSSDKLKVIQNTINCDRYAFNPDIRAKIKEQLGIDSCFVIGHVSNFAYPKNALFMADVLKEVLADNPAAILLLAGSGGNLQAFMRRAADIGIEKSVISLGYRKDIPDLMQAMDVFLLPSHFEGLPIVAIEAQAAGLPCFLSASISREVNLTRLCHFIPLSSSAKEWAGMIINHSAELRIDHSQAVKDLCYDTSKNNIFDAHL